MSFTTKLKKKFFYRTVALIPNPLRHAFYRRQFARVPTHVPEGLTFELARSQEDLEAAFKLLHNAYVEQGFIEPQPSGMRLIIQHALPTTSILVAKVNDRVVGTISVMRDTALGLPMEKVFDLGHLKQKGQRVAELSCLAIHPDFRRNMGGHIFFPLTLFAAMFAEKSFGTDYLIFNLFPQHADFYNAIFGSTHLTRETKDYLGAPATAIQLDLAATFHFAKKKYRGLPAERDLFTYSYITQHSYFKYPQTKDGTINHPVMTPAVFFDFFGKKTQILQSLTALEEQVVARYYPLPDYAVMIPFRHKLDIDHRKESRWDTRLTAEFDNVSNATVLDISKDGCRAFVGSSLELNQTYKLKLALNSGAFAEVSAKAVWKTEDGVCGFKLVETNKHWDQLVETHALKLKSLVS